MTISINARGTIIHAMTLTIVLYSERWYGEWFKAGHWKLLKKGNEKMDVDKNPFWVKVGIRGSFYMCTWCQHDARGQGRAIPGYPGKIPIPIKG